MPIPLRLVLIAALLVSSAAAARNIENFDALAEAPKKAVRMDVERLQRPLAKVATVAHMEERLGVPTFVWSAHDGRDGQSQWVAGDVRDLKPGQAARRYLLELSELYGLTANDVSNARVREVHDIGQGAIIVRFIQHVDGVEVFRSELNVVMNRKKELIAVSGYLSPLSTSSKLVSEGFRLSPSHAIANAYTDLTSEHVDGGDIFSTEELKGGYEYFRFTQKAQERVASPLLIDARLKPVLFSLPGELVPSFYVELKVGARAGLSSDYVSYVVSAKDGRVLFRNDLTRHAANTYKVWANPTDFVPFDSPQGTAVTPHATGNWSSSNTPISTYVTPVDVTLDHAGISTNDPWLTATQTTTFGNNVRAYADIASPSGFNSGDVVADVTSANTFDRTYDVTQEPSASVDQRKASVTQLFYNVNFFHDWYYDVGFTEAAGNAQQDNFGRGGAAGDPLLAEAQDYSGTDNANMQIPADGASPIMQMYRFLTAATTTLKVTAPSNLVSTLQTGYSQVGASTYDLQNVALARANDGTAPVDDACTALPSGSLTGKIALIVRGTCWPAQKAMNAQNAGAVGVIIYNDRTGSPQTLYGSGSSVTIPVVSITQSAGQSLVSALNGGSQVTITLQRIATGVTRDGTLDNGIVAHEWGHYISSRLIGNGNGLNNLQGGGLGEGWGDFHSMLMVVRPEDATATATPWTGVYPMASYAMGASYGAAAYYFGIRRAPYSTRMDRNPLTFKHIGDGVALPNTAPINGDLSGSYNSEVHAAGEIWCNVLWEAYAALLSDSRHTFAQAQQRMKMYLVGGYKATPVSPTFLEARDAILSVAAANDQKDYDLIIAAFARRGMGLGATGPDRASNDNTPVVEDYTIGGNLAFVDAKLTDDVTTCDADGNLDNGETGTLTIRIKNTGTKALTATTGSVSSSLTALTFPDGATLAIPNTTPLQVVTVTVKVAVSGMSASGLLPILISFTDPELADVRTITATHAPRGNFDEVKNVSLTDDVEALETPWTRAYDNSYSWLSNDSPFRRVTTETGSMWHVPNADAPEGQYLISPKLNVGGAGSFIVSFKNRWAFEADNVNAYDGAVLELRVDGTTQWVDIGSKASPGYNTRLYAGRQTSQGFWPSANPLRDRPAWGRQSANYPAMLTTTVDLGNAYAGKTVQLRFRVGSDNAEGWEGWDIDDISVSGTTNLPFPAVVEQSPVCNDKRPVVSVTPLQAVVNEKESVSLTATASDPEGKPLNYVWTQLSGTPGTFSNIDALNTTFTAPSVTVDEKIVLTFRASDGAVNSVPGRVEVLVKNVNHRPVSKVVTPMDGPQGTVVELDGSASTDEDADNLFFLWKQVSGTPVNLSSDFEPKVKFTVPAEAPVGEQLIFTLDVADTSTTNETAAIAVVTVVPAPELEQPPGTEQPAPGGCGCTSGAELAPALLAGLSLLLRARRRS